MQILTKWSTCTTLDTCIIQTFSIKCNSLYTACYNAFKAQLLEKYNRQRLEALP